MDEDPRLAGQQPSRESPVAPGDGQAGESADTEARGPLPDARPGPDEAAERDALEGVIGGAARGADTRGGAAREDEIQDEFEEAPLARVRYGLGKELRLYPDAFTVLLREEHEELRYALANIKRLVLTPGEHNPSKLVLMFELDDGNTVIAAEGVSNVRGFRRLISALAELHLPIELDPPDMDEQLKQALEIRSRYQMGCYGLVLGSCLLLTIAYLIVALFGAHHP
jgi:hypothetical protein